MDEQSTRETNAGKAEASPAAHEHGLEKKPISQGSKAPVRAIGEDDDGYDPYTDWHDRSTPEPLFERDPWN